MYTTDTHALLWHFQRASMPPSARPARGLSPRVRAIFLAADEGREVILVASITVVELVYLSERGVVPSSLVDRVVGTLGGGPENYRLVPLELDVVRHLRDIPAAAVREMPDRIIAATAKATGTRLLTRDESIGKAAGVEVVW